jgi:3-dehydroquinate dehydratase I
MPAPVFHPLVVATINDPDDFTRAGGLDWSSQCDLAEWRLDGLRGIPGGELDAALAACPVPVLLTARRADEGGFGSWPDEAARLAALAARATPGRWFDIEARSLEENPAWREAAAAWVAGGIHLVVSLHDFGTVPGPARLAAARAAAAAAGATVFKVAARADSLAAVLELAALLSSPAPPAPAVMGMGRFGRASRLLFGTAGSRLNYGYLFRPAVPGQWPAAELKRLLAEAG